MHTDGAAKANTSPVMIEHLLTDPGPIEAYIIEYAATIATMQLIED